MTFRALPPVALLAIAMQFASARAAEPRDSVADRQFKAPAGVRVTLEQEVLCVPVALIPLLPGDVKLPKLGSCALLDKQQAKVVCDMVLGNPRSGSNTLPTLTLRDGEEWRDKSGEDYYGFRPQISHDRQAVRLHVVFARSGDRLVVDETVPLGKHVLVHYSRIAERPEATYLDRLIDWIFPNRKHTPEYSELFLLVGPRLASQEEQQQKTGANQRAPAAIMASAAPR